MITVPAVLRTPFGRCQNYPATGIKLEDYFYQRWIADPPRGLHRKYVPIFWTYVYCAKHRRRFFLMRKTLRSVQVPAFTVVQHARGIHRMRKPKCVLTFAAGGVGDVPIPLVYDMPPPAAPVDRKLLAHFSGNIRSKPNNHGKIRSKMQAAMAGINDVVVVDTAGRPRRRVPVAKSMRQCVFALCPRGFGKTSFRLYEAMYYGAIPVYIYDVPWLPYTDVLDWSEFSILCHISQIDSLAARLRAISPGAIRQMQAKVAELVPEFFTLDGVYNQIIRRLRRE